MATFTVGGLSTGIDYNQLISQLMEIKRQPINILENKKTTYNKQISSYSTISDKLSTLKSAADKLKTTSNFYAKSVAVSDDTVLDSTVTGSASVGNYAVSVTSLASEEKEAHSGVASETTVVNSSGSDQTFQYTYGGTQTSVTVADGTTLEGLRDLINNDTNNPGVAATIINDGSSYRLALTGNSTGASNSITIDAGTTVSGFSSADFTETKTAADSSFSVDGISITRSSNNISDVIGGVTFNLFKADATTPETSTISVTADKDAIKTQINTFVTAYNDLVSYIDSVTDYNTDTNTGGILTGESTVRSIDSKLQSIVSSTLSTAPGDMAILAQLGIKTNYETGLLEVNDSTLDTKLTSDLDDVADFFTDTTGGLAVNMYDYIETITSTVDGSITVRKDGLQDIIKDIESTVEGMEYRLEKTELELVKKFSSLESLISGYNATGSMLSLLA